MSVIHPDDPVRNPDGRLPASARREKMENAIEMMKAGLLPDEIARSLGVSRTTVYHWQRRHRQMFHTVETTTKIGITVDLGKQVESYLSVTLDGAEVAVAALVRILRDETAPRREVIEAARLIIESANTVATTTTKTEAEAYIEQALREDGE